MNAAESTMITMFLKAIGTIIVPYCSAYAGCAQEEYMQVHEI